MKFLSNLFKRKEGKYSRRENKKGASLALVMIIGALLVIWVMCIMPLMANTGTVAHQTFEGYLDYLQNRSSIEFCKSELLKMSKTEIPHTFAVIKKDDGTFFPVHNKVNGQTNAPMTGGTAQPEHYTYYVNDNDVQDDLDVPRADADGNKVTAICSVVPTANYEKFEIIIRTFNNGEPGMTYKVEFQSSGSLKIYPEAYRHNSALPLDDFVVVDGWYGNNHAWDSTITMSNATSLNFVEHLLSFKENPVSGYADTGEYPAVFKTTANSAPDSDTNIATPIPMPVYSNEIWVMPSVAPKKNDGSFNTNANSLKAGNIWYTLENNQLKIYIRNDKTKSNDDITSRCKVYLNGKDAVDNTVPTNGVYRVTVDYSGTDYSTAENPSKYDASKFNALPIAGLELGVIDRVSTPRQNDVAEPHSIRVQKIEEKDANGNSYDPQRFTHTVTLGYDQGGEFKGGPGLVYGYLNAKNENAKINWINSNVIENLSAAPGDTYYFYVCRAAAFDANGQFRTDSNIKEIGMLYVPQFVSGNLAEGTYFIASDDGKKVLNANLNADALNYQGDFITFNGINNSSYHWTIDKDSNTYYFKKGNQYLRLDYTAIGNKTYSETPVKHVTDWGFSFSGYWEESHQCEGSVTKCVFDHFDCTFNLGNNNDDHGDFYVKPVDNSYQIFRNLEGRVRYKVYENCTHPDNDTWDYSDKGTETHYLNLNSNQIASNTSTDSKVKFMRLPAGAPDISKLNKPSAGFTELSGSAATITYPTDAEAHIKNYVNNENAIVYANGEEVEGVLNAGSYHIVVKNGSRYGNLGKLSVGKANLSQEVPHVTLAATAVNNVDDELRVDISATGWHTNGGYHYFGVKTTDASKYDWYPVSDVNYSFSLKYGKYNFAVMESGSNNFHGSSDVVAKNSQNSTIIEVVRKDLSDDIADWDAGDFKYTVDSSGKFTWYKLPEGLNPDRVKPVYYYYYYRKVGPIVNENSEWSYSFADSKYYDTFWGYRLHDRKEIYGITIEGTKYDPKDPSKDPIDESYVLQLNAPVGTETLNGHTSSMMKGSALYFMGQGTSIDTYGVPVYLTTDLLVLNSSITGRDANSNDKYGIWVAPYTTTGGRAPGNTMLFAVNNVKNSSGEVIFQAKKFYILPANTNLETLTASSAVDYPEDGVVNPNQVYMIGGPNDNRVRNFFRGKIYPEVDLNICYASKQQLSRIVSGETIGWTNKGKLSVNSNATNQNYCVPVFVTQITGDSSFKANRVLIAGRTDSGKSALNVDKTLKVTTRYLSVDAANMIQGGGNGFYLYNLGQDQNFIQILSNLLKITNYSSQTLQMDYERSTTVISKSGTQKVMSPQICRYNNGVNLFDFAENSPNKNSPAPLMAKYTVQDVESLFKGGLTGLSATVKTVDRYIEIVPAGSDTTINISSLLSAQWDLYSNYVYFSPKISLVSLNSWLESDLRFSSQESGYTTDEYLGLFKTHSADSYAGTLIYFGQEAGGSETIRFSIGGTNYDIPRGDFFYIESSESGISIETLAQEIKKEQTIEGYVNPYRATEEELAMIKVYIDLETGQLGGAYVDTGLDDNTDSSMGGFSGGSVG